MERARYAELETAIRNLRIADIVLVRSKKGRLEKAIRRASHSYWNHSALVFEVVPQEDASPDVLVVEALDKGIEIHRLRKYLREPGAFDVGFKRMEDLEPEERDRILSFFLDMIDTPYDFTRLPGFLLHEIVMRLAGVKIHDYIAQRIINVDNFVCSTFAQRAFYMGVAPNKRERALFRSIYGPNFFYRMEFVTPGDIARSVNTAWLYNPHH